MSSPTLERIGETITQGSEGRFTPAECEGLPAPVQRYLGASIAPGTPLARSVRIRMEGHIKLGRWMPFRARQILNPLMGYVWAARVAWLIGGADHYAMGAGTMDWKLLGLKRLVHAEGPDVSRSAAARGAAEAVWLPTAMLPRFGVRWCAEDDRHIRARWMVGDHPFSIEYALGADSRVRSVRLDRWGDPDETGTWGIHPFGGEMTHYAMFGGLTVPSAGTVGWFYGSERWDEGAFFRFRITDLEPVARLAASSLP